MMRGNYLEVPSEVYRTWGIRSKKIEICCGTLTASTEIIECSDRRNHALSPDLKKSLSLSEPETCLLRYDPALHQLKLGPVVGIFTKSIPNHSEFDSKSVQAELIYMSILTQTMPGIYYIFTPQTIDWKNHTVRGYRFLKGGEIFSENGAQLNKKGVWKSRMYPLPGVIYDRIASRRAENSQMVRECKEKLLALPGIKYFNRSYLNKWEVYKNLSNQTKLQPYLPETMSFHEESLQRMLERYPILFIKPSNGTLGKGIIKLEKRQGSLHFTKYLAVRERGNAASIQDFIGQTRIMRGKNHYIVQQGLMLAQIDGSPFDLRIIYQKDGNGEWGISKQFCRIAPKGSSVANLSRGGKAETTKKIFNRLYRKDKNIIRKKNMEIQWLCQEIAQTLEVNTGMIFGEIGLDLGIDERGHIWLIEINSRPRKTTTTSLSTQIVHNTFRRPLEYARFLTGFQ